MPSAKSARSSESKRIRNRGLSATTRNLVARARNAINQEDAGTATDLVSQASRALDKTAQKGLIHRNNAARQKSRLVTQLQQLDTPSNTTKVA